MSENGVKRSIDNPIDNEPKKKLREDGSLPPPQDKLLIKRTVSNAKLPTRGSAFSAGYDLYRKALSRNQIQAELVLVLSRK